MTDVQSILLVEDSDDDAELTIRAFKAARLTNPILRFEDGGEVLDYLFGHGKYTGRDIEQMPVVILLDLKLPGRSGLDVLAAVRANERTKHIPVVVLTSSREDKDRFGAYDNHANSYVQKPVNYDTFVVAAHQLGLYWTVLNVAAPRTPT
jgi:two-component system, response regulator